MASVHLPVVEGGGTAEALPAGLALALAAAVCGLDELQCRESDLLLGMCGHQRHLDHALVGGNALEVVDVGVMIGPLLREVLLHGLAVDHDIPGLSAPVFSFAEVVLHSVVAHCCIGRLEIHSVGHVAPAALTAVVVQQSFVVLRVLRRPRPALEGAQALVAIHVTEPEPVPRPHPHVAAPSVEAVLVLCRVPNPAKAVLGSRVQEIETSWKVPPSTMLTYYVCACRIFPNAQQNSARVGGLGVREVTRNPCDAFAQRTQADASVRQCRAGAILVPVLAL